MKKLRFSAKVFAQAEAHLSQLTCGYLFEAVHGNNQSLWLRFVFLIYAPVHLFIKRDKGRYVGVNLQVRPHNGWS